MGDAAIEADFDSEVPQDKPGSKRMSDEIADDLYVGEAFSVLNDMLRQVSGDERKVAGPASAGN
jgi:hypothetical protein